MHRYVHRLVSKCGQYGIAMHRAVHRLVSKCGQYGIEMHRDVHRLVGKCGQYGIARGHGVDLTAKPVGICTELGGGGLLSAGTVSRQ